MLRIVLLLLVLQALPAAALDGIPALKSTPVLSTATSWDGQVLAWPTGQAEAHMLIVEIAPGQETGWHSHPVPSFAYVLEGELDVALEDGRTHRVGVGQALAEVVGRKHNGRNVGSGVVRLLVFYAGAQGVALTQKP